MKELTSKLASLSEHMLCKRSRISQSEQTEQTGVVPVTTVLDAGSYGVEICSSITHSIDTE